MLARQLGNKWDVRRMPAQRDTGGLWHAAAPPDGGYRGWTVIGPVTAKETSHVPGRLSR
jgi:hypothetical protein